MVRLVAKLAAIALLLFAGVSLWYGNLEKKLHNATPTDSQSAAVPAVQPPPAVELPEETGESDRIEQVERGEEQVEVDFEVIVTRNIFQAVLEAEEKDSPEEPVDAEDLEETQLQLVLLGTITGNKRDSRAIIVDKKEQKQDIYHIGDAVQGAFITQIDRGKVVIEVDGQPEVLKIKDREGGGPGPPATAAARRAVTSPRPGERTVPLARPRRRISFRQPTPAAAAQDVAEEVSIDQPEEPLLAEEEMPQEDEERDGEPADLEAEAGGESEESQQGKSY